MGAVVRNLHSLGRVAQQRGFNGPTLGAKLASKNPRKFSQEQLLEAKAMPAKWTNRGEGMGESRAVRESKAAQAAKAAEEVRLAEEAEREAERAREAEAAR